MCQSTAGATLPFPAMLILFKYFLTWQVVGMALVGWDEQAGSPGDGLLGIWAGSSAPAPWDAAGEEAESLGGQEQRLNLAGT